MTSSFPVANHTSVRTANLSSIALDIQKLTLSVTAATTPSSNWKPRNHNDGGFVTTTKREPNITLMTGSNTQPSSTLQQDSGDRQPPTTAVKDTRLDGPTFRSALDEMDMDTLSEYIFPKPKSINNCEFQPEDCFLSHRGPDTKLDLVVPLSRLMNNLYGTTSFVDSEPTNMLGRAQAASTADAVAQSLWESKVIVVFISPKFHESEWCLKELYTALYRRQTDPSLKAVHIVYCNGMSPKVCQDMPAYKGLGLGSIWGTEFKEGTSLHDFASNQLHKVLYQLIYGGTKNIQPKEIALAEWRKVCRHRFGIPPKLKYFVGREDKLSEITNILQNYSSAAITTSGIGGVGKTQLVNSWVHQSLSRYSLVVWIRAEQDLILKQDLAMFGEQGVGLHFNDKDGLDQRARRAMQAIKNRSTRSSPSLIIFDNAESYKGLLDQDWIPSPGSYCHSIVTTRDPSSCGNEEQVKVGPLDESSSLAIVEYFLQRKLDHINERPKVLSMLKCFDFLPLAIVNFAVFARKFGLDDAIAKIQHVMEKPVYDKRNYQGQNRKSVDAVLQAQLESLDEGARTMLEYLSVLAAENVPTSLLKSLLEKDGKGKYYYEALEQLMDRAIVLSGGTADNVNTHRLFQSTTMHMSRANRKLQKQLDSAAKCLIGAMKERFDETGNHDRQKISIYLPHAEVLVEHQWPAESQGLAELFYWYGKTLANEAQYTKAMELYEQALVIKGNALGKNHPDYVYTLHAMAGVYDKQGRYTEAMKLYKQALAVYRLALGQEHPDYAATLHSMASLYAKQGRYSEATELYKQALAIKCSALGEDHHDNASTLHNMASLYAKQGQYDEAIRLYKQALEITGNAMGKDHPSYATTLHAMAIVHGDQGLYTDAMELYKQALAITGNAMGKDHPSYATTLHAMAIVHGDQGLYTDAMELYKQALAITGGELGKDHPSYADTLNNMAGVHFEQGQYDEAMELYKQALTINGKAVGKDHPKYAASVHNMAQVHDKQGRYTKAMKLYQEALSIRGSSLGKDHPEYADSLHAMALVHDTQGQYTKAMELYKQALDITSRALGTDHHSYATTLHNMGTVKYEQGQYYSEAMELYEKALAIKSSALSKDHPSYAATLHSMAQLHDKQGRYAKAMELYEKALAIKSCALGEDHPSYAATLHNMASAHDEQGRYTEAMELYKKALAITHSALGEDHPSYAATLHNMALVYDKQGKYSDAMKLYEQALRIKGSALGKDHPSYATTLHNMANVHDSQGRYPEARELYKQALAIKSNALGKDHPSYATTLKAMTSVHHSKL